MSRRELVFRPQASADLREAIEWYDEHSVALALRFRHVMFETFDDFADVLVERGVPRESICEFPESYDFDADDYH